MIFGVADDGYFAAIGKDDVLFGDIILRIVCALRVNIRFQG